MESGFKYLKKVENGLKWVQEFSFPSMFTDSIHFRQLVIYKSFEQVEAVVNDFKRYFFFILVALLKPTYMCTSFSAILVLETKIYKLHW